MLISRHCEPRSGVAIQSLLVTLDCFAVARNDNDEIDAERVLLRGDAARGLRRPGDRGLDACLALTEADRGITCAARAGAERDLVAIIEPAALLAIRQRDRLGAAVGDL